MKIIILFALAAVSVCWDFDSYEPQQPKNCVYYASSSSSSGQGQNSQSSSGHSSGSSSSSSSSSSHSSSSSSSSSSSVMCDAPYNNEHANDETCLKHALEHVPKLTTFIQKLICKYKNHEVDREEEFYGGIKDELREIGRCTGCQVDDLLGTGETLGNTGDAVGITVGNVIKALGNLLVSLGLAEPLGNLMCDLTSRLLTSKCLEKITNSDISGMTSNLEELFCQAEKEQMNMKLVVETMKDVGCLDDTLDIEVLANVTEEVGEMLDPPMRELIEEVKKLPVVGDNMNNIFCIATNILEDILNENSNGGGLLGGGSSGSNNGGDSSGGGLLDVGGLGR